MAERMRHHTHYTIDTASVGPEAALGRVGIGIFNAGRQPIRSTDGRVTLFLTGEFHHQRDRRRDLVASGRLAKDADDAALALAVYETESADGLTALQGVFIVAVWDAATGELTVVNDRFGLYPHYFSHSNGSLAFAPEIKGVICSGAVPRVIDRTAVAQYVRFQHILGDRTWFEAVKLLRPASILRYRPREDRLTVTRYWGWYRIPVNERLTFDEALEQFEALLDASIAARVSPAYRNGIYLTGGLDARLLLAYTARRAPVTTITFGEAGSRDVLYAARLARRAGVRHHWFPLDRDGRWVLECADFHQKLTEGQASWLHAHGMSTLQGARSLIDVNLTGWRAGRRFVADQWFGVSHRSPPLEGLDIVQRLYEAFCSRATWPGLTEGEAGSLFAGRGDSDLRALAFDSFREELARIGPFPMDRLIDQFFADHHTQRLTIHHIVFMRSAFEVRHPYFDYAFMDFIYSLSAASASVVALRKAAITRRMPSLALISYDRDGLLPHTNEAVRFASKALRKTRSVFNRSIWPLFPDRPRLYADYERYLRVDLRQWAEEILFDARTEARGLFDPDAVRALWERHQSGAEIWTVGKLAPLISLELTLRALLDNPSE